MEVPALLIKCSEAFTLLEIQTIVRTKIGNICNAYRYII